MKTWNSVLAIIIMLSGTAVYAQKVEIDQNRSTVEWMGKKLSRKHVGNVQLMSGNLELKDNKIMAGNFVVDMKTITVTDIKDEGSNKKLVGHLKSDDFFGVEKYSTANFKVTESSAFINESATVSGEITIKGKTEPISFEVLRNGKEYSANIQIDRSKFDVRYGSNSFFDNLGDNAIDNIFTLDIKVVVR